jgi:hypothetical protein
MTTNESNRCDIEALRDFNELILDLFCQFTRRRQNHGIWSFITVDSSNPFERQDEINDGDQISEGFTFTCRSNGNEVFHLKSDGNGLHLNGPGLFEVEIFKVLKKDRI